MTIPNFQYWKLLISQKNEKGFFEFQTWPTKEAFTYLKLSCKETAKDKQLFFKREPNEVLFFLWFDKGVEDEEPMISSSFATFSIINLKKTRKFSFFALF